MCYTLPMWANWCWECTAYHPIWRQYECSDLPHPKQLAWWCDELWKWVF